MHHRCRLPCNSESLELLQRAAEVMKCRIYVDNDMSICVGARIHGTGDCQHLARLSLNAKAGEDSLFATRCRILFACVWSIGMPRKRSIGSVSDDI
jgi:hypothetical protein